jgi:hypothetical protein
MGGPVLLIDEHGDPKRELPAGVACRRDIKELPAFLAGLGVR